MRDDSNDGDDDVVAIWLEAADDDNDVRKCAACATWKKCSYCAHMVE